MCISRRLVWTGIDEYWKIQQSFLLHRNVFVYDFSDVRLKRWKFHIQLEFAVSLEKAQVQTLKKIIIDFEENAVLPGQVYVGRSRVKASGDMVLRHNEE